jgi:hypothetical protein
MMSLDAATPLFQRPEKALSPLLALIVCSVTAPALTPSEPYPP